MMFKKLLKIFVIILIHVFEMYSIITKANQLNVIYT